MMVLFLATKCSYFKHDSSVILVVIWMKFEFSRRDRRAIGRRKKSFSGRFQTYVKWKEVRCMIPA
jgi:hypothetical protein